MPKDTHLLTPTAIHRTYGIGRSLSRRLCSVMPHVVAGLRGTGRQILVHRTDLDKLLAHAASKHTDLWELSVPSNEALIKSILAGEEA